MILIVWVYFFVPETKGVPMEEMDKIFGGNQGEEDFRKIIEIRRRLGMGQSATRSSNDASDHPDKIDATKIEYVGSLQSAG